MEDLDHIDISEFIREVEGVDFEYEDNSFNPEKDEWPEL